MPMAWLEQVYKLSSFKSQQRRQHLSVSCIQNPAFNSEQQLCPGHAVKQQHLLSGKVGLVAPETGALLYNKS